MSNVTSQGFALCVSMAALFALGGFILWLCIHETAAQCTPSVVQDAYYLPTPLTKSSYPPICLHQGYTAASDGFLYSIGVDASVSAVQACTLELVVRKDTADGALIGQSFLPIGPSASLIEGIRVFSFTSSLVEQRVGQKYYTQFLLGTCDSSSLWFVYSSSGIFDLFKTCDPINSPNPTPLPSPQLVPPLTMSLDVKIQQSDCQNGGYCLAGVCNCSYTEYFGDFCEEWSCDQTCQNGGLCAAPNQCNCSASGGYFGPTCEEFECTEQCVNGVCVAPDSCDCIEGYNATDCSNPICDLGCFNGGLCQAPNDCDCSGTGGYTGQLCDEFDCVGGCNTGVCVDLNTCNCSAVPYEGMNCETPVCDPECLNGGDCIEPNVCSCSSTGGFYGEQCGNFTCVDDCMNGGVCVGPNSCNCSEGYTGPTCEDFECIPICGNNGKCVGINECNCTETEGYFGPTCEEYNCSQDCLNGDCIGPDTCQCQQGFDGPTCNETVTFTTEESSSTVEFNSEIDTDSVEQTITSTPTLGPSSGDTVGDTSEEGTLAPSTSDPEGDPSSNEVESSAFEIAGLSFPVAVAIIGVVVLIVCICVFITAIFSTRARRARKNPDLYWNN